MNAVETRHFTNAEGSQLRVFLEQRKAIGLDAYLERVSGDDRSRSGDIMWKWQVPYDVEVEGASPALCTDQVVKRLLRSGILEYVPGTTREVWLRNRDARS